MADCIFCRIVEGAIPAIKVAENAHALAFMDINPGCEGHILVIPKTHAADIFTIEPDSLAATAELSRRVAVAAREALGCAGVNLFQANGAAAFQTVFHFHMHVLPRREGDAIRPPWTPGVSDRILLGELAKRIGAAIA